MGKLIFVYELDIPDLMSAKIGIRFRGARENQLQLQIMFFDLSRKYSHRNVKLYCQTKLADLADFLLEGTVHDLLSKTNICIEML